MRMAALVMTVLLAAGCSAGWDLGWARPAASPQEPTPEVLLADADATAAGDPRAASAIYERNARENQGQAVAARALHDQAFLLMDPRSPIADPRGARVILGRLASEYPKTPQGREARRWRLLLRQIDRCEEEATRVGADAERLRQTLETIKDSDLELEQHP